MENTAHHGNMLQFEIPFIPEILPRLRHPDHVHIFYPDPKLPIGVVTRFIGDDHSRSNRGIIGCYSLIQTLRPFMHVEERSDAVRCAVATCYELQGSIRYYKRTDSQVRQTIELSVRQHRLISFR